MVVCDLSGRRFGEYVAVEKIGEGGYGVVYRCELGPLDRPVVVFLPMGPGSSRWFSSVV